MLRIITLAIALLVIPAVSVSAQDLQSGLTAYERGDRAIVGRDSAQLAQTGDPVGKPITTDLITSCHVDPSDSRKYAALIEPLFKGIHDSLSALTPAEEAWLKNELSAESLERWGKARNSEIRKRKEAKRINDNIYFTLRRISGSETRYSRNRSDVANWLFIVKQLSWSDFEFDLSALAAKGSLSKKGLENWDRFLYGDPKPGTYPHAVAIGAALKQKIMHISGCVIPTLLQERGYPPSR